MVIMSGIDEFLQGDLKVVLISVSTVIHAYLKVFKISQQVNSGLLVPRRGTLEIAQGRVKLKSVMIISQESSRYSGIERDGKQA
jgi:hypothetical protein